MKFSIFLLLSLCLLSGCSATSMSIDRSVSRYHEVAGGISLGDSKQEVLDLLLPTQEALPANSRKESDRYTDNDVGVEIYYMRSGRQPDGLTTDDEFTPYIFHDGELVGVGWQILGGPKTQSQGQSQSQATFCHTVGDITFCNPG